ncbi:MAG: dockerin type I domain-containing protein, partial [Bacteroidota bacterium]
LSPEWGFVSPFALKDADKTSFSRDGNTYQVFHDPGTPPRLDTLSNTANSALYKEAFNMVAAWSSHLDPSDGVMWDISPASIGNLSVSDYPVNFSDHDQFYDFEDGGVIGNGRNLNPKTNAPYQAQMVPRGDYARVLAEFWADGPDSETPPGHWFTILNYVSDHPDFIPKWRGQGEELSDLEWEVKSYFTLGGTMHDAAITAWSVKGWYDYIRPVSALRYMARRGQSSNPGAPNYDPGGIALYPGLIEQVEAGDPLLGPNNEHLGKIKMLAWKGPDFIQNPETDVAGVAWILAENWMPYQRPTFVTPPFAGYVSGHSTFSRAAAEVMTFMTGDEYFPGGMGEFLCKQNEFLVFEEGPSVDITLQWATYRDASDECSLSRIWGGIHPSLDDIPGRLMGIEVGEDAFAMSDSIFNNTKVLQLSMKAILEGAYDASEGLMDDFYRTDGLLDTNDPYGLGTVVDAPVLTPVDGDAVVDWVKIQLRDKDDPSNILAEKAALIQRDGDIIDETGKLQISFENMAGDNYFVSLKHYNHLGIMTATPLSLSSTPLIDFTSPLTQVYDLGGPASKDDNGTMTLWAGDANGDGNINVIDLNLHWRAQNGNPFIYGNTRADFNLNGNVNAIDLNFYWRFNNALIEQIPD